MLHPASRLLAWMAFAIALPWMASAALVFLSALLGMMLAALHQAAHAGRLLRRAWLFLAVIVLVYGWATPGTLLVPESSWLSPSEEGLRAGALQAWRLTLLIVGLALATGGLAPEALVAGLYTLLQPLARVGVPVGTLVLRLSLVLAYVQAQALQGGLAARLESALTAPAAPQEVTVRLPSFTAADAGFGAGTALLLGVLLW